MDTITGIIITSVGALASIVGAGVSIWQASKASRIKDEIQNERVRQSLVDLLPMLAVAKNECDKIATPVGKAMRGVNKEGVIDKIQQCVDKLDEHEHRLDNVAARTATLNQLISEYKKKSQAEERESIADNIRKELSATISYVHKQMDAKSN